MSEDEEFIRYHFGEMTPAQREEFRRRLDEDEALAERYERFKLCVEDSDAESTPCGLAERTSKTLRSIGWTSGVDVSGGASRCRVVDWTIGSAAVLIVSLTLIPATLQSRESARRAVCGDNLRQIGAALQEYAIDRGGYFPSIGPRNYAGLFAVRLADGDYLAREILKRRLVCPSSSLASMVSAGETEVVVPTEEELRFAPPVLVTPLVRVMGGSYAYRFGYLDDGVHRAVRDDNDCRAALLGDAPGDAATPSRNHGGCSQNILFQDGAVRFVSGCWSQDGDDHFFLNSFGEIAAGANRSDTVLAPSWAQPGSSWAQPGSRRARPGSRDSYHVVGPSR